MSDTKEDVKMEGEHDPIFDEAGTDNEGQDATVADLFGDEDAAEHDVQRQSSPTPSMRGSDGDGLTESERKHRKAMEYEEEEGEPEVPQVMREAEVNIPKLPLPTSSDGQYWMMRMPNFLKLDTKPFHQDTYEGPQEDYEGEAKKESAIMLDVTNTIRWRWVQGANGEMKKESNSRIVRWSDGSMSLQLGTEVFDITCNIDGLRPTTSTQSQSQSQPQTQVKRPGGLGYLYTQHKHAGVLQCEVPITGTMTLQPTGMFSATHKQLVRAVGQRHSRTTRLRLAPEPTMDPERAQRELQKSANRTARPRKPRASAGGGFGGTGGGGGGGGGGGRRGRASMGSKKRDDVFASDDSGADGNSDDEDGFDGRRKVQSAPKRGGEYVADDFVVSDEDDEEGGSPGGKKRRKRSGDADAAMDSLDEADERIEREAAKRRKREKEEGKAKAGSDDDANEDVDMEDSAEEDEHSIRKAGGKARSKRRAVALDDDEDE
ncbi:hypothetical protein FRC08_005425 [Ceratobasidium sp. 394]|nr:hypothetical protein FRC08_005425 [Ceratobasidium sp. 394]